MLAVLLAVLVVVLSLVLAVVLTPNPDSNAGCCANSTSLRAKKNLPCITETFKTFDKINYFKSNDVSQVGVRV